MASKFILVSIIGLVAAQQDIPATMSVPWIGDIFEGSVLPNMVGSVVTANPTATTLALACATSIDCGLFPAETLVFGPSTWNLNMGDPSPESDFTATMDCVIMPESAICKETAGGTEANFPGSSTEPYSGSAVGTFELVITAGVEKLSQATEATTTDAATSTATLYKSHPMSGFVEEMSASTGVAANSGSVSQTASAAAADATGAANAKSVVGGGGLLSIAAGVIGGMLL
ncbi:uncharacterized protein J4E88_002949 [Alternaria novae-zelandiae]|uniref:uncharacterized protein n=1 Tax=Alternaria novae-zelandiae TaxID=430562 RepID=UPI0020C1DAAC|nr:uncharacterized protein J4E88_002949 [Alternaria novae-zelandiae]KAI4689595.1 hypothetical protein J4E88_002949 [Alternaria novae-zelandiae]